MSGTTNEINILGAGNVQINGNVVGNTLVLSLSNGSTTNIPLPSGGVDFTNLTQVQLDALLNSIRGELVLDITGTPRGYLLPT